jgi:acyl-CoA synthetase (AMP-forming)/AMP-acid ligase II
MHGGGQWLTLVGLYCGGKAIVYSERSFDAVKVLDLAAKERASAIGIVGDAMGRPIAEALLAAPDRWDLSSLVTVGNGGAMISGAVKAQLRQALPNTLLLDAFGASETGAAGSDLGSDVLADRPAFSSDGRTWVLDPETLDRLEPGSGAQGLLARTGHIPLGYWKDEAKTAATFRTDAQGRRWVLPGDCATIDDEGRIVLLGRGSGCINTGGEKVFPEEVEAAIRAHTDVFDAVVVGAPDERLGECIVALVKLREGVPSLELTDLQAFCRASIAGYKVPRRLILGTAPRTNVGKPDYHTARLIAAEHHT